MPNKKSRYDSKTNRPIDQLPGDAARWNQELRTKPPRDNPKNLQESKHKERSTSQEEGKGRRLRAAMKGKCE
ncbi:hypothetical protein ACJRO7_023302, partial [Eucalyptus globulus]